MNKNRWSIWIDVEGFSALYRVNEARAIQVLGELMESLFNIGTTVFSRSPDRLFIHQFGDGFVIVSDFPEARPDRPIAVCLAVMRHLLIRGIVTKAAISGGGFSDVGSRYPETVLKASKDRRHVNLGEGLMTIIPVMGTALITAHKLAAQRSGAVLLLDPLIFAEVPSDVSIQPGLPAVVDWVHSNRPQVVEICQAAGLINVEAPIAEACLRRYIHANRTKLSKEWVRSTLESVNMLADGP